MTGIHFKLPKYFEKRLINILLTACLCLGFVCLATIYLPAKIKNREINAAQPPMKTFNFAPASEKSLSNTSPDPIEISNGVYFNFTPDNDPPFAPIAKKTPPTNEAPENPASDKIQPSVPTTTHRESSLSNIGAQTPRESSIFRPPSLLQDDISFWKDIYSKYDSHHAVLHDPRHLSVVYEVLDFTNIDVNPAINAVQRDRLKESEIETHKEKIKYALKALSKKEISGTSDADMAKIRGLFANINEPDKFDRALERGVRSQGGLKDKFMEALKFSGRYYGEIESIFEEEGVPKELTFLIFVESMFNVRAYSSSGARGIWQFMPGTAKIYNLRVDRFIDERLDPIIETHAAARLLRHNYEELGTWPLAINAFNTGEARLKLAVSRLGTNDIATIIRKFSHPAYGFAASNFYLEFLAAMDVAKNFKEYFGEIEFDPPLKYDPLTFERPILLSSVIGECRLDPSEMKELNPSFSPALFEGRVSVPAGTNIRVPNTKGASFTLAAQKPPTSFPILHITREGETIEDIAALYNVPVYKILGSNKRLGKKLKAGQEIEIAK